MQMRTMEGNFLVASPDKDLFVRLFDFYAIYGAKNHPQLPVGNISFLDCIPATGTNLKTGGSNHVGNLGPSSELNVLTNPKERTLYFYFGSTDQ
ncbi:hypothetical protein, partial [Sphingobacterium sp.]|uniref:hypothetical protein n=1 Tax=Sphingobacterium sp. TaxID=341027 RepID=UPI00289D7718